MFVQDSLSTVFIVDDDVDLSLTLAYAVRTLGFGAASFQRTDAFLIAVSPHHPGCLVMDEHLSDGSGLEFQETLKSREYQLPVIVTADKADVATAVKAMKAGAFDFVEKPYSPSAMLEIIQVALRSDRQLRTRQAQDLDVAERLDSLSSREKQVFELLIDGQSTKQISRRLHIGLTTVDYHRKNVLRKMRVENVVQLTRTYDLHATDSRVESPESRVQSRESRVQSPESRVESRESRVQS